MASSDRRARYYGRKRSRLFFEALETRRLLSSTLLPITDHYDLIFDPSRNQLDIPGDNGNVYRFDVATQEMISTLHVGGSPGPGDITPDGRFLYLTDRAAPVIHKVDLTTGVDTDLTYAPGASAQLHSFDLVILSNSLALFGSNLSALDNTNNHLHTIDLTTDTIGEVTQGPLATISNSVYMFRSADRSTVLFDNFNISGDGYSVYDVAANTLSSQATLTSGNAALRQDAVSRDGALEAAGAVRAVTSTVWDQQMNAVNVELPAGPETFSSAFDTLYVMPFGSSTVMGFDTHTFNLKATFQLGETFTENNPGTGTMATSADGKYLFIATDSGIREINTDESNLATTTLSLSSPSTHSGQTAMLTARVTAAGPLNGSVVFTDGATVIGTVPVVNGVASMSTSSLIGTGVHNFTATFVDATTGFGSPSTPAALIVLPAGDSTLLPITDHYDEIVDPTRNQVYIPGDNGNIYRYDLTSQTFISTLHINGSPGPGDITPDGQYLYLTDLIARVIHKVNLTTGADTDIVFDSASSLQLFAVDLVVVSSTLALFSSNLSSLDQTNGHLHTLDLTTDTVGAATQGPLASIQDNVLLFRSADRSTVLFDNFNISGDGLSIYDVANNTLSQQTNVTFGNWALRQNAVSPDGSLVSASDRSSNTTKLWNHQMSPVAAGLAGGPEAFSSVYNRLYVVTPATSVVRVYDTQTLQLVSSINLGETFSESNPGSGVMTTSPDGKTLFVATDLGVRLVDVNESPFPAPSISSSSVSPVLGDTITLSSQLSALPGPFLGSIVFKDGTTVLGTVGVDSSGFASLPVSSLAVGTHNITATYLASNGIIGTTTSPLAISVAPATSGVTLTVGSPGTQSRPPTFHVVVGSVNGAVPTGAVDLYEGIMLLGTAPLANGAANIVPSAAFSLGIHDITATYGGDGNFMAANSSVLPVDIEPLNLQTTTTLSSSSLSPYTGAQVQLTATVAASLVPDGVVSFYDGNTLLGTGAIDSNSHATLTTTFTIAGPHSLRAVYGGSPDFVASNSSLPSLNVIPATVIDILVLYTPDAMLSVTTSNNDPTTAINAAIASAIAATNLAFVNSQIPVVLRLAHAEEETDFDMPNDSYKNILAALANPHDGEMDNVAFLRSEYNADLVSLFVGSRDETATGSTLGLGDELTSAKGNPQAAFTVINAADSANLYVLAHEIGHNLGASHDVKNDPQPNPAFPGGRGLRFVGDDGVLYHDIMSYGPGQVIPYYSNPNVLFEGVPTGKRGTANAAAVISRNAAVVANYSNLIHPTAIAFPPSGGIDSATSTAITGWAWDQNANSAAVKVRVDIDGVAGKPFLANLRRPDLAITLGSPRHGFVYRFPTSIAQGSHQVDVYLQDAPATDYVLIDSRTINIDTRPQLTLTVGTPSPNPVTAAPGTLITLPVTITNNGGQSARGTNLAPIELAIRASGDATYDDTDLLLRSIKLPNVIGVGATIKINVRFRLPNSMLGGSYYVLAEVDSTHIVDESVESDNVVIVSLPASAISPSLNPGIPSQILTGGSITSG